MHKISCADFAFPLLEHIGSLKLIKQMGINHVDIGLFENRSHIQPSGELVRPEKSGKLLAEKVLGEGLETSDIFIQTSLDFKEFAINHPDEKVRKEQREVFERLCEYSKNACCAHVSGLPGVMFEEDSWWICVDELAWRVDYAAKLGIVYAVEAHAGSIIEDPKLALKMLAEVEGLTLTLDHSHYTYAGIETESLRPLMKYASHMHVRGARKGEMQCSVARNETDFPAVVEHIKETGYRGGICIEYTYTDWKDCNRTDNVSETIILKRLMQELLV
jgi:sugar phosphate isomerase/epimerase